MHFLSASAHILVVFLVCFHGTNSVPVSKSGSSDDLLFSLSLSSKNHKSGSSLDSDSCSSTGSSSSYCSSDSEHGTSLEMGMKKCNTLDIFQGPYFILNR
jgi:hypothetical protein